MTNYKTQDNYKSPWVFRHASNLAHHWKLALLCGFVGYIMGGGCDGRAETPKNAQLEKIVKEYQVRDQNGS